MKIHEYQGKELFRNAGVPVPNGFPAFSVEEAVEVYKKLDTNEVVVKAQIHAGGRGKGGGVKLAIGSEEVQKYAHDIFGMDLITHQTGPEGKCVQRLLIEEAFNISRELYAGIVLDRSCGKFVFMVSSEGGVEIEKVATESPEKIIKEWIEPTKDLKPFQASTLIKYGGHKKFNLTNKELSLICASHSAEKIHTDTVSRILKKIQ